jgi:pimeloyl-ACP methyl ester carboxylesterase
VIFETADDVALHLDLAGEGPDFVFQHGLCGDRNQTAQVCPAGVRRLTLECRGHGLSQAGSVERLSVAQFTEDLAAMIGAHAGRPVVGGISMGAAMALRLAVTRPDLVGGLVLARPAWGVDSAPPNMAPNALVGEMIAKGQGQAEFEATETAHRLADEAPDNLTSLRGFFDRQPLAVTSALLTRISADGPGVTAQDLAALRMPVLVIGHGRDHVHPWALAETLAAMIPGAELVRIPPKSDPTHRAEFTRALGAFLGV